MFKQYVPYVEDTVLGIFVECKADVSTFYINELLYLVLLLCIHPVWFSFVHFNFWQGLGKFRVAICLCKSSQLHLPLFLHSVVSYHTFVWKCNVERQVCIKEGGNKIWVLSIYVSRSLGLVIFEERIHESNPNLFRNEQTQVVIVKDALSFFLFILTVYYHKAKVWNGSFGFTGLWGVIWFLWLYTGFHDEHN